MSQDARARLEQALEKVPGEELLSPPVADVFFAASAYLDATAPRPPIVLKPHEFGADSRSLGSSPEGGAIGYDAPMPDEVPIEEYHRLLIVERDYVALREYVWRLRAEAGSASRG